MSVSTYRISVPVFKRGLAALSHGLTKAEAFAVETGRPPEEIFAARLAPDMLAYSAQIQRVSDTAKNAIGRVLGVAPPAMPDEEKTFAELQDRIARTVAYLDAQGEAAIDARAGAEVVMKLGGNDITFTAEDYLLNFALPNFYFHVATAHGILRQLGVAIGKRDYLGSFA
jgi:hypothetical protein